MKIGDWLSEIADMAQLAEAMSAEYLGKPAPDMDDVGGMSRAFTLSSRRNGLEHDPELDERLSVQAISASLWRRSGGTRFVLSDSVAASFALTKQSNDPLDLPFPAFVIQVPRGYMPSTVGDECEGLLLVVVHGEWITCTCYAARDQNSGSRVLSFSRFSTENASVIHPHAVTPQMIQPSSQSQSEESGRLAIRFVRNFAAWIRAFPIREFDRLPKKQGRTTEIGTTEGVRGLFHLKTSVTMDVEMRRAAREMMRSGSSFAAKKMAMRHIVRGHWKRQVIKGGHKLLFVAPYWRGPDGPAAWGRVYKLFGETALPADVN